MAGNTISVPVVGCMIATLLATTQLRSRIDLQLPRMPDQTQRVDVEWIGNGRACNEPTSRLDILVPKMQPGQSGPKKRPSSAAGPSSQSQLTKKPAIQKKLEHYF